MTDLGLFGPDSVTWRVHADPAMAFGGLRALLLQALHPVAMAGVAQHSSFRNDPWGRLFRTADYVGTVTYGTTADAVRAGARVRGIHQRLSGVEATTGRAYRVDDPDLLRWVHCCETDSFLVAYRRCGGRLSPSDADRYVAEQGRVAELVGLARADVPDSTTALAAYFQRLRPELVATDEALAAARFVLSPPMPLPARPAWLGIASVSFGMLPAWARA